MSESAISLDVNDIKEWRSIVTLIVFVITSARIIPPSYDTVLMPTRLD